MPPTRNEILDALFALISNGEGQAGKIAIPNGDKIAWTSRKLRTWGDVPQKPAMIQTAYFETISQQARLPYKKLMEVEWWIYLSTVGASIPDELVQDYVDACQAAIAVGADPDERQTLGGLVYHVYLEGQIFKVPGDLDGEALITVPVKILVP